MIKKIEELIKECMNWEGVFDLESVCTAYFLKYKSTIDESEVKNAIRHLNDDHGYIIRPFPHKKNCFYIVTFDKKRDFYSLPTNETPEVKQAKKILELEHIQNRQTIIKAFQQTVKKQATGDGGYKADMDTIVQAKKTLLNYYKL